MNPGLSPTTQSLDSGVLRLAGFRAYVSNRIQARRQQVTDMLTEPQGTFSLAFFAGFNRQPKNMNI